MDVHKGLIVATTRSGNAELGTREFGAYTSSLTGLRGRCKSKGVAHVAMESTGLYMEARAQCLGGGLRGDPGQRTTCEGCTGPQDGQEGQYRSQRSYL